MGGLSHRQLALFKQGQGGTTLHDESARGHRAAIVGRALDDRPPVDWDGQRSSVAPVGAHECEHPQADVHALAASVPPVDLGQLGPREGRSLPPEEQILPGGGQSRGVRPARARTRAELVGAARAEAAGGGQNASCCAACLGGGRGSATSGAAARRRGNSSATSGIADGRCRGRLLRPVQRVHERRFRQEEAIHTHARASSAGVFFYSVNMVYVF